jgi:hypothetical protein
VNEGLYTILGVVLGSLLASVVPYVLEGRRERRTEIREVALALRHTLDLVYPGKDGSGWADLRRHLDAMGVRLELLGAPVDQINLFQTAARACWASADYIEDVDIKGTPFSGWSVGGQESDELREAIVKVQRGLTRRAGVMPI